MEPLLFRLLVRREAPALISIPVHLLSGAIAVALGTAALIARHFGDPKPSIPACISYYGILIAGNKSDVRSRNTPTSSSGPAPSWIRRCAIWFARSFNSR